MIAHIVRLISFVSIVLVQQPFENAVAVTAFRAAQRATSSAAIFLQFFAFDDITVTQSCQQMASVDTTATATRLAWLLLLLMEWGRWRSVARSLHKQNA